MTQRWLMPVELAVDSGPETESFPSYLLRLASAHGASVGRLVEELEQRDGGCNSTVASQSVSVPCLVRPNRTTRAVVDAMSRAGHVSGETLRRTTFLALEGAVHRTSTVFCSRVRWCPACFNEARRSGRPPYLKLLWSLTDVIACREHAVYLRDRCQHCSHVPRGYARWNSFLECQRCSGDLTTPAVSRSVPAEAEFGSDLFSLVGNISERLENYPCDGVRNCVRRVFDAAWESGEEVRLWNTLSRDEWIRHALSDDPITLTVARRIAVRLDVPLPDLLEGRLGTASFPFVLEPSLPGYLVKKARRAKIDSGTLDRRLREVLAEPREIPLSLKALAKAVCVSENTVRNRFPSIATDVVARWCAHKTLRPRRQHANAMSLATEWVASWHERSTELLTKKSLLRRLRAESRLPKNLLRAVVAHVLDRGKEADVR